MDGTEDDLFIIESDEECQFDGFSPAEIEDAEEYSANVQTTNEEIVLHSDSDIDSVHVDDYDCDSGSPGN